MAAVIKAAEAQEAEWMARLHVETTDLAQVRIELSTRADTLRGLSDADYSRWCEWMGEMPHNGDNG